jgi:ketosteroid isomerase-like protein
VVASPEQNKAIAQRFFREVTADPEAVMEELLASDYIGHFPSTPPLDREGTKRVGTSLINAFGYQTTIEDQIAEGDRVATRWTLHGIHRAEFRGIAPTGTHVEVPGITIFRMADGKIAEHWISADFLGLVQQLGGIPGSESASGH